MSSESEDLTTFVTFFNVYKYRVMLFELINESAFVMILVFVYSTTSLRLDFILIESSENLS